MVVRVGEVSLEGAYRRRLVNRVEVLGRGWELGSGSLWWSVIHTA